MLEKAFLSMIWKAKSNKGKDWYIWLCNFKNYWHSKKETISKDKGQQSSGKELATHTVDMPSIQKALSNQWGKDELSRKIGKGHEQAVYRKGNFSGRLYMKEKTPTLIKIHKIT